MKKKKIIIAGLFLVVISLILSILSIKSVFNNFSNKITDNFQKDQNRDDIVIIAIDEKSITELSSISSWPHQYYADIIKNTENAKIIGFDLVFTKEKEDSKLFGNELKKINAVIGVNSETGKNMLENIFIKADGRTMPLDIYANSANSLGELKSIFNNNDEIIRSFNFGTTYNDKNLENLSIAVSRLFLDIKNEEGFYDKKENLYYLDSAKTKYIPVDSDKKFKIKFFSKPFGYKYYSFSDVLNGKVPKKEFENKIVLVGPTASIFQDTRFVPTSNGIPMPGVEIHANAIQTIIDQDFLVDQSKLAQSLTILAITAISCIALMYLGIIASVGYVIFAGILYTLAAKMSFNNGIILNMLYPYIAILLSFASIYLYRYFTEIKSKKQIEGIFSRYVNPEVVKKISENPDSVKLGGDEKEITIFFSDIVNFTHLSEGLTPTKLVEILNEYFTIMGEILMKHHGTLDKYEGDAIMAFFGAPLDDPDHAYHACMASLEGRAALKNLHEKWKLEGKPLLDYRVGLNTGLAIVGNVGSVKRLDYTAMGDNVNLASRLESINNMYKTRLCISETTYEKVKDRFECRKLDMIKVKGKDNAITIYELLGEKGALNEQAMNLIKVFEEGFGLYQKKDFVNAKSKFEEALKIYSEDNPSKIFIERCDFFIANPPAAEWAGVWEYKDK